MELDHALEEGGLGHHDVLDRLPGHRLGQEAHEVAGMTGAHGDADLAVGLEAADPRTVAGARVDDDERPLALIHGDAGGRDDPRQHVVHRPRQRPAVHDQLGLELQDVGRLHRHVLEILVAPLPQDVEKQHAALPGIQAVLGGGGPGEGARRGRSRALGVCHVRAPVLVDLSR